MPTPAALAAFAQRRGTADRVLLHDSIKSKLKRVENVGGVNFSQAKALLAESALRVGAAGGSLLSAIGVVDRESIDALNRRADEYGLVADELFLERTGSEAGQFVNRSARQAGVSAITSIPVAFNAPSLIIGQSLMAANQGFTQAIDAGLPKGEAAGFAFGTGAIEGVITGTFQKLGLGGLESGFRKQILNELSRNMAKRLAQRVAHMGKQIGAEELEEIAILYAQSAWEKSKGVDTRDVSTDELAQVALTTLMSSGTGALAQTFSPAPRTNANFEKGLLAGRITNPTAVDGDIEIADFEQEVDESLNTVLEQDGSFDNLESDLEALADSRLEEEGVGLEIEQQPEPARPAQGEVSIFNREDLQPADLSEAQITDTLDQMEPALRDIVGDDADIKRTKSGFIVQRPGGSRIGVFIISRDESFKRAGRANPDNTFNSMAARPEGLPFVRKGVRLTREAWKNMKPAQRESFLRKKNLSVGGFTITNPKVGAVPLNVNSAIFMTEGTFDPDVLQEEHAHDIMRTLLTDEEINQVHDELVIRGVIEPIPEGKRRRNSQLIEEAYQAYNQFLISESAPEPTGIARMFQRIKNFFGRIKNAILRTEQVEDKDALRGLFQSIQSGEVAGRPALATEAQQATVLEEREAAATKQRRGVRRERKVAAKFVTEPERAVGKAEQVRISEDVKAEQATVKAEEAARTKDVRAEQAEISDTLLENIRRLNQIETELEQDETDDADAFDSLIAERKNLRRENAELRALKTALGARRSAEAAAIKKEQDVISEQRRAELGEIRAEQAQEDVDLTQGEETFSIREGDLRTRAGKQQLQEDIAPENIEPEAAAVGLKKAFQTTTQTGKRLESEAALERQKDGVDEVRKTTIDKVEVQGRKLLKRIGEKDLIRDLESRLNAANAGDFVMSVNEASALRVLESQLDERIVRSALRFPRAAKAAQDQFLKVTKLLDAGGSAGGLLLRTFKGAQTPEDRMTSALSNAMSLNAKDRARISALRETNPEAADIQENKIRNRNLGRFRDQLQRMGFDLQSLKPEDFADDNFNISVQKAGNVAREGRRRGAIINSLYTQAQLGIFTLGAQIPGTVLAGMFGIARGGTGAVVNQILTSAFGKTLDTQNLPADFAPALEAGIEAVVGPALANAAFSYLTGLSKTQQLLGKDIDVFERSEGIRDPTADLPLALQLVLNPVFRPLGFLDEIVMTPIEAYARVLAAYRIGRSRGMNQAQLIKFVRQQGDPATADPEVLTESVNAAEKLTFKDPFNVQTKAGGLLRLGEKIKNFDVAGGFAPAQVFGTFFRGIVRLGETAGRHSPGTSLVFAVNDVLEAKLNPDEDGNLSKRAVASRQIVATVLANGLALLFLGLDDETVDDMAKATVDLPGAGLVDFSRADPAGLAIQIQGLTQQALRGDKDAIEVLDTLISRVFVEPLIVDEIHKNLSQDRFTKRGFIAKFKNTASRKLNPLEFKVVRDIKALTSGEDKTRAGIQKRETFGGQKRLRRDPGIISATAEVFGFRLKSQINKRTKVWINWADRTPGIGNKPFIASRSFVEKEKLNAEDKERYAELAGQKFLRLLESSGIDPTEKATAKEIKKAKGLRTKAVAFAKRKF